MPTVRRPVRTVCADCANRCRVEPVEHMLRIKSVRGSYWLWMNATLCPVCRVAHHDWWVRQAELGKAERE